MKVLGNILHSILLKKVVIRKWQIQFIAVFMFSAGAAFGVTYLTNELVLPKLFAATSPWTQTDWSGGSASGTVTGTVTTYESESNIALTGSDITLDTTAGWAGDYTSWAYRKEITFDNTDATLGLTTENLTDFPVLIKLDSGTDIDYSKTKDNGEDIRFADSDGTALSYEIEDWNESGTSYVWVKVPQIDQNSSTDSIYMYYGNSGASDAQNASAVWSNGFVMVYHLAEGEGTTGSGSVVDSTGNTAGTPSGGINFAETGQVGSAVDFSSGTGISLGTIGNSLLDETTTISFWMYSNNVSSPSRQNPYEQAYGGWGTMTLETDGRVRWFFGSHGGNSSPYIVSSYSATNSSGTWQYLTVVRDDATNQYTWYRNGDYSNSASYTASYPVITDRTFIIGDGYVNPLNGLMDEFRVTTTTRTAAWVAADYASQTDSFTSYGSEEGVYVSSGTLTSNILNAEFAADWGTLTYSTSGSGSVSVKVRTDSNSDMSGATAWGSCTAVSSGSDLSSNGCVTDTDQYIQYQVTLTPSGASAPVVEDISIAFTASDQVAPDVNATSVTITGVADGAWHNAEPTITWTSGEDDDAGNGLLGYCISLDEVNAGSSSSGLDPATSSGSVMLGLDDGVSSSACDFIVEGTSVDLSAISGLTLTTGKQYYFSIKAVDLAGNIYTGTTGSYQDLVSFKYDATKPSNPSFISLPSDFIATKSATIIWPTSGNDAASDADSGLAGLQYRIGSGGVWYGDSHTEDGNDVDDLLANDGSYSTQEDPDFGNINQGNNLIYFRTKDNAGNFSTTYVSGVLKVNSTAPSSVQSLAVTPSDNTTNSYAFSWDAPTTYTGQEANITYCYTVNALPTAVNCTFTSAGQTSLSAGAYATQPGTNVMYVVAKDEAGNINYDTYSSIEFTYSGSAPGIPQSAEVADISVKATSAWKLVLTWEEPSDAGAGIESYQVFRSTSATSCTSSISSFTNIGSTSGVSYTDTGLSQQDYYYCVRACDNASNCGTYSSTVTGYPDGKFTTAAELTSGPLVSGITTKKATITWSTDRTSDSSIAFGTSSGNYNSEEVSNSTQETSHTINLTNLKAGTTYYYVAKWTDEDGNTGISDEKSFTTESAPTVKDIEVSQIGINSALLSFTATGATKAKIYYGPSTTFGGLSEISTSTSETTYTVQLTGLEDDTKYFFKVNTLDVEDEEYEGSILDFATLPRPRISNVRVQEVPQAANPTVLVTWTSNTDISSIVTYYPEGNPAAAQDVVDVARVSGTHRTLVRGLLPNRRYVLIAKGVDKAGNEAVSDTQTFTTSTDTRPPLIENLNIEGNVQVQEQAEDGKTVQLIVSWDTDEPATSQVEFGEGTGTTYSQQTQEDKSLTFNHVVIISGLRPSSVYHLRAISKDEAGNVGKSIDTVTIAPKVTDDALSLVLSNLRETFGFLDAFVE